MTDTKRMKNGKNRNGISPVATAAGVIIGAGLGVAGAVALSNKKNRAKIDKALKGVQKQGSELIDDVKTAMLEKKTEANEIMEDGKEKAKKIVK